MAKFRFFVLLVMVTLLWACSTFFSRNDAFEKVHTVAVVSVYVNRDLGLSYWKSVEDKTSAVSLTKQGLMNASYQALQKQMSTTLSWRTALDIRQTDLSKVVQSDDQHYEGLHGITLVSPAIVQQMAQGQAISPTTKAFIKEVCIQINVDALAVMIIDAQENRGKLGSLLSDDDGLPEIMLKIAVVNRAGDFVLSGDDIPAPYVGDPLSKKALVHESTPVAHEKIMTAFQLAIKNGIDTYFYQAARNFWRMGYAIKTSIDSSPAPESPVLTPALQLKSHAIEEPSMTDESRLMQPTQKVSKPASSVRPPGPSVTSTPVAPSEDRSESFRPVESPRPVLKSDTDKTPQNKRRSLWSLPDNIPE